MRQRDGNASGGDDCNRCRCECSSPVVVMPVKTDRGEDCCSRPHAMWMAGPGHMQRCWRVVAVRSGDGGIARAGGMKAPRGGDGGIARVYGTGCIPGGSVVDL